jgi:UTP--glucose-1-phosphate uridylyltransferase
VVPSTLSEDNHVANHPQGSLPGRGPGHPFLPATKASPKEMLPVVDKPLIQYAAEEAEAAGVDQLIFITGRNKRSIEDHFDKAYELEAELEARVRPSSWRSSSGILPPRDLHLSAPGGASGLGHAVLCAKPVVGNEPFACSWPTT